MSLADNAATASAAATSAATSAAVAVMSCYYSTIFLHGHRRQIGL